MVPRVLGWSLGGTKAPQDGGSLPQAHNLPRQFSRFLRPGMRVLPADSDSSGRIVAAAGACRLAIVVTNQQSASHP